MTPEEFKALIDSHGSDLRKWPHDRRMAATALLDHSEDAQAIFNDAQAFETLLKAREPVLGDSRRRALIDGVMDAIEAVEPPSRLNCQEHGNTSKERATFQARPEGRLFGVGGVLSLSTPTPGTVAALLVTGVVLGAGAGFALHGAVSIAVLYGGFELWLG